MFIDIHCHCHTDVIEGLGRPDGSRFPRPKELIDALDTAGIDMAVMLSTTSPAWRYGYVTPEEVIETCRKYPERLIPFCNLDPRFLTNSPKTDFRPMLQIYKDVGFKGIGEYMANLPFDDPLNMNLFRQVGEIGFPVIFHVAPERKEYYGCYDEIGLPRLEKVLKACPDLILLGHSQAFWAEIGTNIDAESRKHYPKGKVTPGRLVELMRNYPNLHGDLSAGSGLNAISRDPQFGSQFLEEFQDRLYFGTDIAGMPAEYPQVDYFKGLKARNLISTEAYEKITWQNAVKLLELDVDDPFLRE